jgi:hypothetical protein
MPSCFVVMGFGEKNDLATGRKLNLDATYKNVIKPAVEAAGHHCVRADEIRHSGVIDIPMYDMLFDADLVIADLSTANLNAMFELGIRHALKPRSTIIIAEKQFVSPFDVNHIVIIRYEHLGSDIGYGETMRMRGELQELIEAITKNDKPDSPVYSLLHDLSPPHRQTPAAAASTEPARQTVARPDSYAAHWENALAAKDAGDFAKARGILRAIYDLQAASPENAESRTPRPRVIQELALATYKAGEREAKTGGPAITEKAYADAIELLRQLDPEHTTDPETLGLWSAVHKRRSDLSTATSTQRRADIDIAIYSSERGFLIRQDYYTGINLAYLLDLRASLSGGDDCIADRILADRVRRRVAGIARKEIEILQKDLARSDGAPSDRIKDELYWLHASLAEALIGLADPAGAGILNQSKGLARAAWMIETTMAQIDRMKDLRQTECHTVAG